MSKEAMLPCIVCGTKLDNSFEDGINQPSEGTEFQTYGHYGSTFWDDFAGEQLVLNVCDECLKKNTDKLGREKRFRNVVVTEPVGTFKARTIVGREWLDRQMVPYFEGDYDDDAVEIEPEEIGTLTGYNIEWRQDWESIKTRLLAEAKGG